MVDDGTLVGIFTEKDLLNRVLAKGLDPDHTMVADVMTPNPDTVSSTMIVIEALQEVSSVRHPVVWYGRVWYGGHGTCFINTK